MIQRKPFGQNRIAFKTRKNKKKTYHKTTEYIFQQMRQKSMIKLHNLSSADTLDTIVWTLTYFNASNNGDYI